MRAIKSMVIAVLVVVVMSKSVEIKIYQKIN
jgi:hypothetical protein